MGRDCEWLIEYTVMNSTQPQVRTRKQESAYGCCSTVHSGDDMIANMGLGLDTEETQVGGDFIKDPML